MAYNSFQFLQFFVYTIDIYVPNPPAQPTYTSVFLFLIQLFYLSIVFVFIAEGKMTYSIWIAMTVFGIILTIWFNAFTLLLFTTFNIYSLKHLQLTDKFPRVETHRTIKVLFIIFMFQVLQITMNFNPGSY